MKFVLKGIFIIAITTSASVLATNQVVEPNRIDHTETGQNYSQEYIQQTNAEWQAEQDRLKADAARFKAVFGDSPHTQPPPCPEDGCG